jgi:hypothetical protein
VSNYYDLDGKPISMTEWARQFSGKRWKMKTEVGQAMVSTVHLGLNHQWDPDGPPLIFETMIFGGEHDQEQWRYTTREQAEAGHVAAVLYAGQDHSHSRGEHT